MITWVLLRGLARESRHWGSFTSAFGDALPAGDLVVALDLPGNGTRWRERAPATVRQIVEGARGRLAALGHAPPYVLVALSLGGMVAREWAARHAGEVRGCVLINSSMRGLSPPWQRLRPAALIQLLAVASPGRPPLGREQRILRLTSNFPVSAAIVEAWAGIARTAPVSRSNMLRQLLAAARYRAPGASPGMPTLLLASRRDRLVSVRCSEAMASAWQVPLRVHPGAGHDLALDDPAWLVEQVLAWRVDVSQHFKYD